MKKLILLLCTFLMLISLYGCQKPVPAVSQTGSVENVETAHPTAVRYKSIEEYQGVYRNRSDMAFLYKPDKLPSGAAFSHIDVREGSYVTVCYTAQWNDAGGTAQLMYTSNFMSPKTAIDDMVNSNPGMFREISYQDETYYYTSEDLGGDSLAPSYFILYEADGYYMTASIPMKLMEDGKQIKLSIEDALEYTAVSRMDLSH